MNVLLLLLGLVSFCAFAETEVPFTTLGAYPTVATALAGQGVALLGGKYYLSNGTVAGGSFIYEYDGNFRLLRSQAVSAAGTNRIGAICAGADGYLWAVFQHTSNGTTVLALIRAGDLQIERIWDVTSSIKFAEPIAVNGNLIYVGGKLPMGVTVFSLQDDQLRFEYNLKTPAANDIPQGLAVRLNKLYVLHSLTSPQEGIFEYPLVGEGSRSLTATRVWKIPRFKAANHLEGFDFVPGTLDEVAVAEISAVTRHRLGQFAGEPSPSASPIPAPSASPMVLPSPSISPSPSPLPSPSASPTPSPSASPSPLAPSPSASPQPLQPSPVVSDELQTMDAQCIATYKVNSKALAGQGITMAEGKFYVTTSNATIGSYIAEYDLNWKLLRNVSLSVGDTNHIGALAYDGAGNLWGGFMNGTTGNSFVAKIRISDLSVVEAYSTGKTKFVDPVTLYNGILLAGVNSPKGISMFRLDAGGITALSSLSTPSIYDFPQGVRVKNGRLYVLHTLSSPIEGIFEYALPSATSNQVGKPLRVWPISRNKATVHLEGFDFVDGSDDEVLIPEVSVVTRWKLLGK